MLYLELSKGGQQSHCFQPHKQDACLDFGPGWYKWGPGSWSLWSVISAATAQTPYSDWESWHTSIHDTVSVVTVSSLVLTMDSALLCGFTHLYASTYISHILAQTHKLCAQY